MGKVLFIACTNVGIGMIEEIYTNQHIKQTEIVGVVNINPVLGINKANYHDYIEVTHKYNIPLHYCNNINDKETLDWIREKNPDLIIQTGWSQKFLSDILALPKYGCIGEHPAPLPKGRGAACINWAILTGETKWGDTFFQMVEQYDKGIIYDQESFVIEEYDNVKTVYDKVESTSRAIIARNIDNWSNGLLEGKEQTNEGATYYHRRKPSDGEFLFKDFLAKDLHNFIRAQTHPYPGSFFYYKDKKIAAISSKNSNHLSNNEPGSIVSINNDGSVTFVCKNKTTINIYRIKPENEPETWANEYFKAN